MVLEVKHAFQSLKGDGPDATLVKPSDWNAVHNSTMGEGLAGNPGPAVGPIVEIPIGTGLGFEDGILVATVKALPVGIVMPLAGNYEPPGWLYCDGRAVSRDTYAVLFTITQTKFGAGDGVTTFNIPDLRGRVPAGKDNMGGVPANRLTAITVPGGATDIGKVAGTEQHLLVAKEIPTHIHDISQNAHRHFVTSDEGWPATSEPSVKSQETVMHLNTGAGENSYMLEGLPFLDYPANRGNTSEALHTHTTTMPAEYPAGTPITFDQPHLNLQPMITMSYIIFTGVYPPV